MAFTIPIGNSFFSKKFLYLSSNSFFITSTFNLDKEVWANLFLLFISEFKELRELLKLIQGKEISVKLYISKDSFNLEFILFKVIYFISLVGVFVFSFL